MKNIAAQTDLLFNLEYSKNIAVQTDLIFNIDDNIYKINVQYKNGSHIGHMGSQQFLDVFRALCDRHNISFDNQQHKVNGLIIKSLGKFGECRSKVQLDKEGANTLINLILESANPPISYDEELENEIVIRSYQTSFPDLASLLGLRQFED